MKGQADKVLTKGRACHVLKVRMKIYPLIDLSKCLQPVFDLLKQHCSDTVYSCMSLADFYATLSLQNEKPFDYWIWLHNAPDIAEEGLKRKRYR